MKMYTKKKKKNKKKIIRRGLIKYASVDLKKTGENYCLNK